MNYLDMINSENTDSKFYDWTEYRNELTDYIISSIGGSIKKGSWIAIWGAGGCNDMDVEKLSKDYKLLLIDQDVEKLSQVRDKLGLSSEVCKVADVNFWNITDDDYEMFQALLYDGADITDIDNFFQDLINNMSPPINLQNYFVECSVAVGLASQLNARFAAILHLNKDKIQHLDKANLNELLNHMNKLATERLYVSIRQLTSTMVITGYEINTFYNIEDANIYKEEIENVFEAGVYGGNFLSGKEQELIRVAGNEHWNRIIYKTILMDKLEDVGRCKVINWPFTHDRIYNMLMVSLNCV